MSDQDLRDELERLCALLIDERDSLRQQLEAYEWYERNFHRVRVECPTGGPPQWIVVEAMNPLKELSFHDTFLAAVKAAREGGGDG